MTDGQLSSKLNKRFGNRGICSHLTDKLGVFAVCDSFVHFRVESRDGFHQITISDPFLKDRLIVSEFEEEIIRFVEQQAPQNLVVSFEEVTICSSEIVNALLRARKRLKATGGRVTLCRVNHDIRNVFRMLNLEGSIFPIVADACDGNHDSTETP